MKKVTFEGWKNCIEMTSGDFRIIITTEIGPRVMGGFVGNSANIFNVDPELAGKKGGKTWVNYGGHRLWHAPEQKPRTYEPDNSKVQVEELEDGTILFSAGTDKTTGICKTLAIKSLGNNKFRVEHRLRNDNPWEIELAPWALSVMAPGGTAIVPQNKAPFWSLHVVNARDFSSKASDSGEMFFFRNTSVIRLIAGSKPPLARFAR
jgi:hypothetical protein